MQGDANAASERSLLTKERNERYFWKLNWEKFAYKREKWENIFESWTERSLLTKERIGVWEVCLQKREISTGNKILLSKDLVWLSLPFLL